MERVRRLFVEVRGLTRAEAVARLDATETDETVRALVGVLLKHDAEQEGGNGRLSRDGAIDARIGTSIGPWRLDRRIGRGGSGIVYEASRTVPSGASERGALKLLETRGGRDAAKALELERAALSRLDHPAIARLIEAGTVELDGETRCYVVTEFVAEAEPLFDGAMRDGLDLEARIALLVEIAEAVGHAHARGVVHRDLKPGNILLDGEGRPRIVDFGIAWMEPGARSPHGADPVRGTFIALAMNATSTERSDVGELPNEARRRGRSESEGAHASREPEPLLGTLAYLAPEQIDPRLGAISPATDVYALGVLAYRLLTGEAPYEVGASMRSAAQAILHVPPVDPRVLRPAIPAAVAEAVLAALSKSPKDRPRDAQAFAVALRGRSPAQSSTNSSRRRVLAAASIGLLATVASAIWFQRWSGSPTEVFSSGASSVEQGGANPPGEDVMKNAVISLASVLGSAVALAADLPVLEAEFSEPTGTVDGPSAAINGDLALFGDRWAAGGGRVRAFRLGSTGWSPIEDVVPPTNRVRFGTSLAISPEWAVVGDPDLGGGRVHVWKRTDEGLTYWQTLAAPDLSSGDALGWSVAVDGTTLIAGRRLDNSWRGAVDVYDLDGQGQWQHVQFIQGPGTNGSDEFGWMVDIKGDTFISSAWLSECGYSAPSGTLLIYERNEVGVWEYVQTLHDEMPGCTGFAFQAALGDGWLAIGASEAPGGGLVRIVRRVGGAWVAAEDFQGFTRAWSAKGDLLLTEEWSSGSWPGRLVLCRVSATGLDPLFELASGSGGASGVGSGVSAFDGSRVALMTGAQGGVRAIDIWKLDTDCDSNGISDADEIAAGAPDCNGNGIPDSCDYEGFFASPQQAPFGAGAALAHTFTDLPEATAPVTMTLEVRADLGGVSEFVTIAADGTTLGTFFGIDGADCPVEAATRTIELSPEQFNALAADGSIEVSVAASNLVSAKECPSSFAQVSLQYAGAIPDCNGNGLDDLCEIADGSATDCDGSGVPDSCEGLRDCDGNGEPDVCQIATDALLDKNGDGVLDACNYAAGDFDLDGQVGGADLAYILGIWGAVNPPVGDLTGDGRVDGADLAAILGNWGVLAF